MTNFPRSPRLSKGAIVSFDELLPVPNVIIFQYNPKEVTRQLAAQSSGQGGARSEVQRLKGPPVETISFDRVDLDAADQLERGDSTANEMGVYPQLSALEMLLYPKSSKVIANTVLMAAGTIEILPNNGPFTLFVWGAKRVVPVQISSFTITEKEFDPDLNPIRAEITNLSMRVLTYNDLSLTHPGHHIYLAHQIVKEAMALIGQVNSLGSIAGGSVSF